MTGPQTILRLLDVELDRLEVGMLEHLRRAVPPTRLDSEHYVQSYGKLLELRAMVSGRYVEVSPAQKPQEPHPAKPLHSNDVLAVIDALIRYHDSNSSCTQKIPWGITDHRYAAETLKQIRDHLDRCYEIRSCD
jgi:hypothetical protein